MQFPHIAYTPFGRFYFRPKRLTLQHNPAIYRWGYWNWRIEDLQIKIKPVFICGCGGTNYNLEDWFSHWKHGSIRLNETPLMFYRTKKLPDFLAKFLGEHPRFRAVYFFLATQIWSQFPYVIWHTPK